jgi:hypothetical protein
MHSIKPETCGSYTNGKVSEYTVAQLIYMLEVATAMAGKLQS